MSGPKIEYRVGVKAPTLVVWELLADIEAWPRWNPIYTQAKGKLGYGEALNLTCKLPDQSPIELAATVTEWVPEEQILWSVTLMRGLVRTTRYLEIDKLTDTGCIFANGEMIEGLLAGTAARRMGRSMYKGFVLMGDAVKAEAERIWAEQQG